jgi:hypothetical protein
MAKMKLRHVGVRLEAHDMEALQKLAAREERTWSDTVRILIRRAARNVEASTQPKQAA